MEVYNLFVSSENRDTQLYPDGNSYILHLPTILHNITHVELLHATVPNSIYNVSDGTDVISVTPTDGTSNAITFSIPPGYYDASGLACELTNAIFPATEVKFEFLKSEGKFFIYREGNPFTITILSEELRFLLKLNEITTSTPPPSDVPVDDVMPLYGGNLRYYNKNYIKSLEVVNLHPQEGIFLDIEELRSTFNRDAKKVDEGDVITRSFGMIPLDVNSGCIKRFKKSNDYDFVIEYPYAIQSIDRLTIKWVDQYGRTVRFNGADDNSFLLRIHTDIKKEGIQEIPEQPILYENVKHFNIFVVTGVILIVGLIILLLLKR